MNLDVCVLDDENYSAEFIAEMVRRAPGLTLVGVETDPIVALGKLLSGEIVADVLLLDIHMPAMDGLKFAEHAVKVTNVVFVTAKREFSLKAFRLGAYDYLVKPLDMADLLQSMDRMRTKLGKQKPAPPVQPQPVKKIAFKFGVNHENRLVNPEEIVYVESNSNYAEVYSETGMLVKVIMTMGEMAELLGSEFMQVHRSFIVRMDKVVGFDDSDIRLAGNYTVSLGRSAKEAFRLRLKDYIK